MKQYITIKGAKEHNLKNIDIKIPRNELVVLTGLSGSGKSSLAFDTIYAEGQRRYMESLSSYARQFFFTALGNGLISATISFLRTLVFQTSSVILLPLLLGVDGIWYAITAAEIFATLISIIFLLAKRRKYHYM